MRRGALYTTIVLLDVYMTMFCFRECWVVFLPKIHWEIDCTEAYDAGCQVPQGNRYRKCLNATTMKDLWYNVFFGYSYTEPKASSYIFRGSEICWSVVCHTDSMDVVLFADQFFGSDHEPIQAHNDAEGGRDAH